MRPISYSIALVFVAACVGDSTVVGDDSGQPGKDATVDVPIGDTSSGCTSSQNTCADATTLKACKADGSGFDSKTCAGGCGTSPTPHCKLVVPTAPVMSSDFAIAGTMPTTLPSGTVILNTDTGAISAGVRDANTLFTATEVNHGIAYRQTASTGIFVFHDLTVPTGTTLKIVGTRGGALVAVSTMTLMDAIDVRPMDLSGTLCAAGFGGAGGFAGGGGGIGSPQFKSGDAGAGPGGGSGGPGYSGSGGHGGGGGGGAHGGTGGNAGIGTSTTFGGGSGGTPAYDTADLTTMMGGSGGGGGGDGQSATAGGGGGALQLVAGEVMSIGTGTSAAGVNASGCGGLSFNSGGGGGAGGAILVEAAAVQLAQNGALVAKGGGGADTTGDNGATSVLDDSIPLGGGSVLTPLVVVKGGNGAAKDNINGGNAEPSSGGGPPQPGAGNSNGGGGAGGRIRLNAVTAPNIQTGAILSPNQTSGATTIGVSTAQ